MFLDQLPYASVICSRRHPSHLQPENFNRAANLVLEVELLVQQTAPVSQQDPQLLAFVAFDV
jgi:hypothetical protein